MISDLIYRATTAMVASVLAVYDPARAASYRRDRDRYRAYAAASTAGAYQLWAPQNYSGSVEVANGTSKARAKVRDLERNNPLVAGIVRKRTTMIVGDMIGLKPIVRDADGKPLSALNKIIEDRFYQWAETAMADGSSLTEGAQLVQNHLTTDGEIMARDIVDSAQYKIQLLEADYLATSVGVTGVTYDKFGKPETYHLYKSHPGGETPDLAIVNVPADEIHFLAERTRASQHRGISPLVSAVQRLYGLDDLDDAELIAARSSAAYGLVITSPSIADLPTSPYAPDGDTTNAPTDANARKLEYLESGGVLRLQSGETASSFKSERPNSNFDSFHRGRIRTTAGAAGLSYESASGDYSQVNYSSARMGRVIEWGGIKRDQARMVRWLNRVYRKWLSMQIGAGLLPISAAEYMADPQRWSAVTWQLAGNDAIDPVKEIDTTIREVQLGVNSRTRYAAERGRDFAEIVAQLQEEKDALVAAGLYQEDPLVEKSEFEAIMPEGEAPAGQQGKKPVQEQPDGTTDD
jgi:lambda family phage portal protein